MIIKTPIQYLGHGPYSKSLLNRAWIVKSYYSDFNIIGSSQAEDVQIIKNAIQSFSKGEEIFCGQSASAFRFMALRVSRQKGRYKLSGDLSLFSRPHHNLISIFGQLGVHCEFESETCCVIDSKGWVLKGDALTFSSEYSSQFASAVLLNSFELDRDLFISLEGCMVSPSYLKMTCSFLRTLGLCIEGSRNEFHIPKNQKIVQKKVEIEQDMSCSFTLACFAALKGQVVFTPWLEHSIQPDFIFPQILKKMGVSCIKDNQNLKISSTSSLIGGSFNLNSNPDLFPSLAVLCALSKGVSLLYGAPHLKYKESDRLEQVFELIKKIDRKIEKKSDGLRIEGSKERGNKKKIVFDPKSDHRMAMAACLLSYYDFDVEVQDVACINKSFPEFCNIIGYHNKV